MLAVDSKIELQIPRAASRLGIGALSLSDLERRAGFDLDEGRYEEIFRGADIVLRKYESEPRIGSSGGTYVVTIANAQTSPKVTPIDKKDRRVEKAIEGIKNADADPLANELRCRGGAGLQFVMVKGRTDSSGEQIMYMTVDFQHAAQPAGLLGRNLQPGQCAFAERALRTDEPDQIIQEIVSFGQLREKLHGSTVDTSPTAAERYPDAKNVPQYLSDAKHYWSFFLRQNAPLPSGRFEASYSRYWKPSADAVRPIDDFKQRKGAAVPVKP